MRSLLRNSMGLSFSSQHRNITASRFLLHETFYKNGSLAGLATTSLSRTLSSAKLKSHILQPSVKYQYKTFQETLSPFSKAHYFKERTSYININLYEYRSLFNSSVFRTYSSTSSPGPGDTPEKVASNEIAPKDKEEKVTTPKKKKPIMARIKEEILHYYHGFKLLALETKISSKLLFRMLKGYELSRREQRQLKRTLVDLFRLVPFLVFIIVPFMEFLLPVALKLFPNMLPSTFESKDQAELKRQKLFKARLEVSNFLQETVAEKGKSGSILNQDASYEFSELFRKVRTTGQAVSTEALLKLAKELKDELTLDNLSRPQLVSLCRYMNIPAFGTDAMLGFQIRNRMRYLRADDRMINAEGLDELTESELTQACQSRGIRTYGLGTEAKKRNLQQWLELNLKHKIPTTLLIMSQAFSIPESQHDFTEALQATLSSLPEELVKEAELTYSETIGSATNKQRLEVLEDQEERIAEEKEQEEREEEARKRDEEEKEARNQEKEETEALKQEEEKINQINKSQDSPQSNNQPEPHQESKDSKRQD